MKPTRAYLQGFYLIDRGHNIHPKDNAMIDQAPPLSRDEATARVANVLKSCFMRVNAPHWFGSSERRDLIDGIATALAERPSIPVLEALKECSDDLAAEIDCRYGGSKAHPSLKRKYARDMEPVLRARSILASIAALEGK